MPLRMKLKSSDIKCCINLNAIKIYVTQINHDVIVLIFCHLHADYFPCPPGELQQALCFNEKLIYLFSPIVMGCCRATWTRSALPPFGSVSGSHWLDDVHGESISFGAYVMSQSHKYIYIFYIINMHGRSPVKLCICPQMLGAKVFACTTGQQLGDVSVPICLGTCHHQSKWSF